MTETREAPMAYSATEAGESAQQAGEDRGAEEQGCEEEDAHVLYIVLEGVEDGFGEIMER